MSAKPNHPPPRLQCTKCPWKVSADPNQIPNGYDAGKHAALKRTIADPQSMSMSLGGPLPKMACHETQPGKELPCVGWLHHQLGEGNNMALRMAVIRGKVDANYELDGEQHARFEDTLPKQRRRTR